MNTSARPAVATEAADASATPRHTVWLRSDAFVPAWTELAPMLEAQLPVRFTFAAAAGEKVAGELLMGSLAAHNGHSGRGNCSSLQVPVAPVAADGKVTRIKVKFADHAEVPFPFRGRTVETDVAVAPKTLPLGPNEIALASTEAGVVWTLATINRVRHYQSGFPIPSVPAGGNFRDVLHGGRFLEMLPVIHWLREVTGEDKYEGLPLRADFMFDDPNLHWPTYGFVKFAEIVEHARKENYHVSFATVPLDGWFTHQGAAEIFRQNRKYISFLIHGNNHTHKELLGNYTGPERAALLQQAIRRIEKLERKARLEVSRVMAAPHGACSDGMLEELARCGFESATISHGSQRVHNMDKPWTKNLGYLPSEVVRSCPVMPRWSMTAPDIENIILLAAYLRQPIILIGHHQDLRGGIGLLDRLARFINALGPVEWPDLAGLSRMNYLQRLDGDTVRLRPLGRKLQVILPANAKQLLIENPINCQWGEWKVTAAGGATLRVKPGEAVSLAGMTGPLLVEQATSSHANDFQAPKLPLRALGRRLATEARDRIFPK